MVLVGCILFVVVYYCFVGCWFNCDCCLLFDCVWLGLFVIAVVLILLVLFVGVRDGCFVVIISCVDYWCLVVV